MRVARPKVTAASTPRPGATSFPNRATSTSVIAAARAQTIAARAQRSASSRGMPVTRVIASSAPERSSTVYGPTASSATPGAFAE